MKAIRFVALLLVLVTVLPLAVSAYGKDDNTLLITHINTSPSTEGSAIILSGSSVKKRSIPSIVAFERLMVMFLPQDT